MHISFNIWTRKNDISFKSNYIKALTWRKNTYQRCLIKQRLIISSPPPVSVSSSLWYSAQLNTFCLLVVNDSTYICLKCIFAYSFECIFIYSFKVYQPWYDCFCCSPIEVPPWREYCFNQTNYQKIFTGIKCYYILTLLKIHILASIFPCYYYCQNVMPLNFDPYIHTSG